MKGRYHRSTSALRVMTLAIALLVLLGDSIDSTALTRISGSFAAMQVTTAINFGLLAVAGALAARASRVNHRGMTATALVLLAGVVAIAGVSGIGEITDTPFPWSAVTDMSQNQGRMSGFTATGQLVLSLGIGLRAVGRVRAAQGWGIVALALGSIGLSGYMYGHSDLYGVGYFETVAVHTAFGITVLGLAELLESDDVGLTRLARSRSLGGALVRSLLPAVVLVPSILGWISVWLLRNTDLGPGPVIATLCTTVAVAFGVLVWIAGNRLRAADVSRAEARQAHRATAAALNDLERVKTQLERANRDLHDFTSGAAHDLRAPLGVVKMGNQMLRLADNPEKRTQIQDRIDTAVARGQTLIDDILDYQSAGNVEIWPEEIALDTLSATIANDLGHELEREINLEADAPPPISADPHLIDRVMRNLLSNAVKYTPGSEPVAIRIEAATGPRGMVKIWVSDRGLPIAPDERERAFEIFHRGLEGARVASGSGVGLATCRRVIERHGGTIGIEDREGWSKSFCFTLPLAEGGEED